MPAEQLYHSFQIDGLNDNAIRLEPMVPLQRAASSSSITESDVHRDIAISTQPIKKIKREGDRQPHRRHCQIFSGTHTASVAEYDVTRVGAVWGFAS